MSTRLVLAVGLEGPHELSGAPPAQDVVVRAVPNERLALIKLAAWRPPACDAMIKLTGSGQLAVGASQKRGLKAAVPQRQKLRALCARRDSKLQSLVPKTTPLAALLMANRSPQQKLESFLLKDDFCLHRAKPRALLRKNWHACNHYLCFRRGSESPRVMGENQPSYCDRVERHTALRETASSD